MHQRYQSQDKESN